MKPHYFIQEADLGALLGQLEAEYSVYVPVKKDSQRFYKPYSELSPADKVVLGEVRAFEPLKAFFSGAREKVAGKFGEQTQKTGKPYAIIGAKACDLKGFKIQDFVFSKGFNDPFYVHHRKNNLIVGADCTCAIDTCYCLAVGIQPFPQEDFDMNLSEVVGGFVVQTGSAKGQALVDRYPVYFKEAGPEKMRAREELRAKTVRQVEENLRKFEVPDQAKYPGIIEKNFESKLWHEESRTCVECGACNMICPTCHCFLLYDQKDKEQMARFRVWDSCMIKDFARTAGGGNPRKALWMRLRNRFEKKFDFFPKVSGVYACTGCGRCISACPAKIDIRKVLKRLVEHV